MNKDKITESLDLGVGPPIGLQPWSGTQISLQLLTSYLKTDNMMDVRKSVRLIKKSALDGGNDRNVSEEKKPEKTHTHDSVEGV